MEKAVIFVSLIAFVFALWLGMTWLCMTIWNSVLSDMFGTPELGFWHMAGVLFLIGVVGNFFRNSK